ncbi:MAG: hypothetical protein SFZ02_11180 [bacterium]|nr:hypothetical protein [bacterium]
MKNQHVLVFSLSIDNSIHVGSKMPNLVEPIKQTPENPKSISEVIQDIRDAHHYLVSLGKEASQTASQITTIDEWGSLVKRTKIIMPEGNRPKLISSEHESHSLIEVINQCATMERLIDALNWAIDALPNYYLLRCNPTTSSERSDNDHDIVLINPNNGQLSLFEVSDVTRGSDSNRKEFKDLASLGIQLGSMKTYMQSKNLFVNRLFMVVSIEFGNYILERIKRRYYDKSQPYFRYDEPVRQGNTYIFEVKER